MESVFNGAPRGRLRGIGVGVDETLFSRRPARPAAASFRLVCGRIPVQLGYDEQRDAAGRTGKGCYTVVLIC